MTRSEPVDEVSDRGADNSTSRVVVGVDGSEPSKVALAYAAEEARFRGLPLEVVMTWHEPIDPDLPWPPEAELAANAQRALEGIVHSVLGDATDLKVQATAVAGQATRVLNERSVDASLVVVGSRGHGEVLGLLLGSVSEYLASHAHCPVLIVRGSPHHPRMADAPVLDDGRGAVQPSDPDCVAAGPKEDRSTSHGGAATP